MYLKELYNTIHARTDEYSNFTLHPYPGTSIDTFMQYYRSKFPEATVTPKLHMLEDHVIPFLQKWRVGFGFHGEQGAESLHALINRIYGSVQNRVDRLKSVIKEHHLQVSPLYGSVEEVAIPGAICAAKTIQEPSKRIRYCSNITHTTVE